MGHWEGVSMTVNPLDKCNRCGVTARPPRWDRPGIALTRHHIIPRSQGGSNRKENIEILCWPCHAKEHGLGGEDPGYEQIHIQPPVGSFYVPRRQSFLQEG